MNQAESFRWANVYIDWNLQLQYIHSARLNSQCSGLVWQHSTQVWASSNRDFVSLYLN